MDLHVVLLLLFSTGSTVQSKPKLCNEAKQKEDVSARTINPLGFFRPGFLFRSSSPTEDLPQPSNKRPGSTGLFHGTGGNPDGGYGVIHGGGESHILSRNKIFGQGVGLKNNSLSQKIGNLINHQNFGILSGNSFNVNRTQQNNSGPSYQVYLPGGLHQTSTNDGHLGGPLAGGVHGGTNGGILGHGHRPHGHLGGSAAHQGGHLAGLLGHHHGPPNHHSHHPPHGSHGALLLGTLGNGGPAGFRPGHHLPHNSPPGSVSGSGAGLHHGKPGGLGLIHGGIISGGLPLGTTAGHRPLPHGMLGLIHGALGNQGVTSSSGVNQGLSENSAVQAQQHHGGLLGLLQNGVGTHGVLIGGVGGNHHFFGGSGTNSNHIFGQNGILGLIHGSHSGAQGGSFQTVTSSQLKPGHVYLHLGELGLQYGGQTFGTAGSNYQLVGGSSTAPSQVYGQEGESGFTHSGQNMQGSQVINAGGSYQTVGTSQTGQYQSQHNLHQGTLSQSEASSQGQTASGVGEYGVSPGQQLYQGTVYETQWSQSPSSINSAQGGAAGASSTSLNTLNQVNQGSNNFVSEASTQNVYGNQNIFDGSQQHGSLQTTTNGNYYNSGHTPTPTGSVGIYGFNQGQGSVFGQTLGQGSVSGGTLSQHSHQSSSSSSFGSNSSSQTQENNTQQSYFTGNVVGANSGEASAAAGVAQIFNNNNYGGTIGQYGQPPNTHGSGYTSNQPDNTYDNKQGNYEHGSVVYLVQQSPLADETFDASFTGGKGGNAAGSVSGMSGGSGTIASSSQGYLGANSASSGTTQYGGTNSASQLQGGSHVSSSTQPSNVAMGSVSHGVSSSPSLGSSGSSIGTDLNYNSQSNQPAYSAAELQSTGSQHTGSTSGAGIQGTMTQYGSRHPIVMTGSSGSSSSSISAASANETPLTTNNIESSASEGGNAASNLNSVHSTGSSVSTGSLNGEENYGSTFSTQTSSHGHQSSSGSSSGSTDLTNTGNNGISYNTAVSNSRPTATYGSAASLHKEPTSSMGQYSVSGTRDTPSGTVGSVGYGSSYNSAGSSSGSVGSSTSAASSIESGHQNSAFTSNVGSFQQRPVYGSSINSQTVTGGQSGYVGSTNTYPSQFNSTNHLSSSSTTSNGSPSQLIAPSSSAHSSVHGSSAQGSSGQYSAVGGHQGSHMTSSVSVNDKEGINGNSAIVSGSYNQELSSSHKQSHKPSVSVNNKVTESESPTSITSNTAPSSNKISGSSGTGSTNTIGSSSHMYGGSSSTGHHISGSGGYGNQVSGFAENSNENDQSAMLNSKEGQAIGSSGNVPVSSQHFSNSGPSGNSAAFTSQSSNANRESITEINGSFNNGYSGSTGSGLMSNQYSNFDSNINQIGTASSTSGGSGTLASSNESQGPNMVSVLETSSNSESEINKYPPPATHTGSTVQLVGSSPSSIGGMGSHLSSSSASSQHYGSLPGYTGTGGNAGIISSHSNGYNSMLNTQGYSSNGFGAETSINKDLASSVQPTSFRYPGQYSFKYGYVPPGNIYTNALPSSGYESPQIVQTGNTGVNGYYYQYSNTDGPAKVNTYESYPIQEHNLGYFSQSVLPMNINRGQHTLLTTTDEEDGSLEENQNDHGIRGNLEANFQHSGAGSFESGSSRPFQSGLSFAGNHEINTGISGSVSGHLGNVGNFQGFLGNAANKVGGLISGVGHAVGIIRDQDQVHDSQMKLGSQESSVVPLDKKVQGDFLTSNQYQIFSVPVPNIQGLETEQYFPKYFQENYSGEFGKTVLNGQDIRVKQRTNEFNLPLTIIPYRESKDIKLELNNESNQNDENKER